MFFGLFNMLVGWILLLLLFCKLVFFGNMFGGWKERESSWEVIEDVSMWEEGFLGIKDWGKFMCR